MYLPNASGVFPVFFRVENRRNFRFPVRSVRTGNRKIHSASGFIITGRGFKVSDMKTISEERILDAFGYSPEITGFGIKEVASAFAATRRLSNTKSSREKLPPQSKVTSSTSSFQ